MKFFLFVLLVPLLLIPLAAVGMHVAACGIHVTSLDDMWDRRDSAERQGRLYGYCKFMSGILRPVM